MEPESKRTKLEPQRIHIENSFVQTEHALHPDQFPVVTHLQLEDVQIDSELLISCIRRMPNIQNIDLINVTLFGGIFLEENEKLILPNLTRFKVHLSQMHDGGDNDDAPEILPDKVRSLLFFTPPLLPEQVDIDLKVLHEDGFWQDYFTSSDSGSVVYSALGWNPSLMNYVSFPTLKELSLHNCTIRGLIPVQSLTSLTLSAVQGDSAQYAQLLSLAATSSTLEHLTLRQHGSLRLDDLLLKTKTGKGRISNLKQLTLISTEIDETTPPPAQAPFPHLHSVALVDCNLSQYFTNVYKNYFKDVATIRIQEFPISCELIHTILQCCPQSKILQLHKFNLDSCWEADIEPENQSFTYLKQFLASKEITIPEGSRPRLSFELEKESGTNWKCNWVKNTERESELGDEFESHHRETTAKRYTDAGVLVARDAESLLLELQERQDNLVVYCKQLRIVELYGLEFDSQNLHFLQACSNLVVLKLENMKVNRLENLSCEFLSQPSRPILPRLQKYVIDLSIKNLQVAENITKQLAISDFIWFSTTIQPRAFQLADVFSWNKVEILIDINRRTVFELSWKTGLLNFGSDLHGSEILAHPQFVLSFALRNLYLRELSHAIPAPLQSRLESIFLKSCDVEYPKLTASIAQCQQLKELVLRDVNFVGIPDGAEYNIVRSLEKVTFTKRGT